MNAMWRAAFRAAGQHYDPARLVPASTPFPPGCRNAEPGWVGAYCYDDLTVRLDAGALWPDNVASVLAHEVGHHVSGRLHGWNPDPRNELAAECLAGVWARAAGAGSRTADGYGSDEEHGSADDLAAAFAAGYARARPADCDVVWTDDL